EPVETAADGTFPARHRGDVGLDRRIAFALGNLWIAACEQDDVLLASGGDFPAGGALRGGAPASGLLLLRVSPCRGLLRSGLLRSSFFLSGFLRSGLLRGHHGFLLSITRDACAGASRHGRQ